jgi:homoserine kinase
MTLVSSQSLAFAPATIGNVSIGFDVLGMAIGGVGDQVALQKRSDSQIKIVEIHGEQDLQAMVLDLPKQTQQNTAGAALLALQAGEKLKTGFDVFIHKGIPLGSGMGGSAASAVAAVVAASALLKKKLTPDQQFRYALEGEKIASGAAHPDNVAPCIHGGLTLSSLEFDPPMIRLPFPKSLAWVLVHPNVKVETKIARKILKEVVPLSQFVGQTARLSAFITGVHKRDFALIQQGFTDLIIEPQRAHLIPGFEEIKAKVLTQKGVLGFSISGSGPSVFALAQSQRQAEIVARLVVKEFALRGLETQSYVGVGPAPGARLRRARNGRFL